MNNTSSTKRLTKNDGYKRPKQTMQSKLTPDEIKNKLKFYTQVDDIKNVPIRKHVRYFTITNDGKQLFRLGGFLQKKDHPDYVVLSNGKNRWTVQTNSSIFFKKMTIEELDEEHQKEINKLNEKIRLLEKINRKYQARLA